MTERHDDHHPPTVPPIRLLTTAQAAGEIQVSVRTIWRYIADGRLKALRLPDGQYRVERDALYAILKRV